MTVRIMMPTVDLLTDHVVQDPMDSLALLANLVSLVNLDFLD